MLSCQACWTGTTKPANQASRPPSVVPVLRRGARGESRRAACGVVVATASCKALKVAVTVVYVNWAGNSDWLQKPSRTTSYVTLTSSRCRWTSCSPCSVRSKTARSARGKRSSACRVHLSGMGRDGPRVQAHPGRGRGGSHPGHGPTPGASGHSGAGTALCPAVSDRWVREYLTALVTHYGQWIHPERRQVKGPSPNRAGCLCPGCSMRRWSSATGAGASSVSNTALSSARQRPSSRSWPRGWKINTAFAERLNLDFRQHVAAIGRRVNTLCKHEAGLRQQLTLFHAYHNVVLPHVSLRVPLPDLDAMPEIGAHQALAASDAGDGGRADGSRLESERGAHVSRPPVAPTHMG